MSINFFINASNKKTLEEISFYKVSIIQTPNKTNTS